MRGVVEAADGVIVEKDPKTHGSRRIALDDETAAALEAQRERMAARASACETVLTPDAHVFSRAADGLTPWVPNEVTKAFTWVRTRPGSRCAR